MNSASFYSGHESAAYKRRGDSGSFLDNHNYGRRSADIGFHGSEADVSGCRIFHHDIYHYTERSDRRNREAASSAEQDPCSGHEVAMMMSIALRFIPILLEETDKIMKAQMARGADFESGNLIQRARAMIPILVPLFVSAFRRANDLAMAMEARCYHGGEGRTKMKPLKYHGRDRAAYAATILYMVVIFVVGRFVPFKLWIF